MKFTEFISEMGTISGSIDGTFHNRENDWNKRNEKFTNLIKDKLGSNHYKVHKILNQYFLTDEDNNYLGSIEFDFESLNKKIGKIRSSYKKKDIKRFYKIMFTVLLDTKEIKEIHSDTNLSSQAFNAYKKLLKIFTVVLNTGETIDNYEKNPNNFIVIKENKVNLAYWENRIFNEDTFYTNGELFTEGVWKITYNNYHEDLDIMMFGQEDI